MAETKKRERAIIRLFTHDSAPDKAVPRAGLDVNGIVFKFADDTEERFDLASVFPNKTLPEPCVARAAAAFGINTSAGNAGNTLPDGEDGPEEVHEAVAGRLEMFSSGRWSAERQSGGPRTSILMEALAAYRKANGADVGEATLAKFRAMFEEDKEAVKRFMAVPDFRATYEKLKADKAAERAAKAAADAKGNKGDGSELLA